MIKQDKCGFWHPVIDKGVCIECNLCHNSCPINKAPRINGPTKAFAYQNSSDDIRFNSTSGGFFYTVATNIINNGGIVCGAAFDKNMNC